MTHFETDVLIIGCGISGATAALRLAKDPHLRITIVTPEEDPRESNTYYAQGGIIYRGDDDSPELLIGDIERAGAGLSNPVAVRILAEEGPDLSGQLVVNGQTLDAATAPAQVRAVLLGLLRFFRV